jgi:hypothetical protein
MSAKSASPCVIQSRSALACFLIVRPIAEGRLGGAPQSFDPALDFRLNLLPSMARRFQLVEDRRHELISIAGRMARLTRDAAV